MPVTDQPSSISTPPPSTSLSERLFGDWVRRVSPATLRADALAGLLGAVLVLPQGIAFATLAGLPPEYGLYTAVIPCIIAALFGSSWHVMSGPTNANSLALFAMLSPLALAFTPGYIQLALAVTVMVGVMQWLIGALRLGVLANFISPAVLFGFTSGAALLIALYALPDVLGLDKGSAHGALAVMGQVGAQILQAQPAALAIAGVTVAAALLVRRFRRSWPYMLVGLVLATGLAWVWARYIGSEAGYVPLRPGRNSRCHASAGSKPRSWSGWRLHSPSSRSGSRSRSPKPWLCGRASALTRTASFGARGCRTSSAVFSRATCRAAR
jgi:sulfate permease, SulP family